MIELWSSSRGRQKIISSYSVHKIIQTSYEKCEAMLSRCRRLRNVKYSGVLPNIEGSDINISSNCVTRNGVPGRKYTI